MAKKDDEEKKGRKRKSAYKLEDAADAAADDGDAGAAEEEPAEDVAVASDEAEVIDLDEARDEAAEGEGQPFQFFETKVGKEVQRAVRGYLVEKVVPPGKESGDMELNVDADFVRQHGAAIVSTVVESVTNALIPKNLNFTVPVGNADAEAEAPQPEPKPTPEPGSGVALNLDFGKLLRGLFTPRPAAPAAEGEAASAAPTSSGDEAPSEPQEGADS